MVCINEVKKERRWNFSGIGIEEVEEYKYLEVTANAGLNGGFQSMWIEWWMRMEYLVW